MQYHGCFQATRLFQAPVPSTSRQNPEPPVDNEIRHNDERSSSPAMDLSESSDEEQNEMLHRQYEGGTSSPAMDLSESSDEEQSVLETRRHLLVPLNVSEIMSRMSEYLALQFNIFCRESGKVRKLDLALGEPNFAIYF